jgi:hypothetical protein
VNPTGLGLVRNALQYSSHRTGERVRRRGRGRGDGRSHPTAPSGWRVAGIFESGIELQIYMSRDLLLLIPCPAPPGSCPIPTRRTVQPASSSSSLPISLRTSSRKPSLSRALPLLTASPTAMDSYQYAYSDASSGPRTPSPQALLAHSPANYKLDLEPLNAKPIFVAGTLCDDQQEHGIAPEAFWQSNHASYTATPGSLLSELYEHELPIYSHPPQHPQRVQQLQQQDVGPMRRATYPYVRQEREDLAHYTIPPFLPTVEDRRPQHVYAESHHMLEHAPQQQLISLYEMSSPHAQSYDPRVKLEDTSATIIPPQMLYRSQSMDHMHHQQTLPLMPHPPHPVQLTDDAASKETQYLRRRCTNCSQTEPPSWRRSTLNPGKIGA